MENKTNPGFILRQPVEELLTLYFLLELFSLEVWRFFDLTEIINQNKAVISFAIQKTGKAASDEAGGAGYYYDTIFIHLMNVYDEMILTTYQP